MTTFYRSATGEALMSFHRIPDKQRKKLRLGFNEYQRLSLTEKAVFDIDIARHTKAFGVWRMMRANAVYPKSMAMCGIAIFAGYSWLAVHFTGFFGVFLMCLYMQIYFYNLTKEIKNED